MQCCGATVGVSISLRMVRFDNSSESCFGTIFLYFVILNILLNYSVTKSERFKPMIIIFSIHKVFLTVSM